MYKVNLILEKEIEYVLALTEPADQLNAAELSRYLEQVERKNR